MSAQSGEQLPIPAQLVELHKKSRARAAVESIQMELILLKHLVATLDPKHDYVFNKDELTLMKVARVTDGENDVQLGASQDGSFGNQVPVDGGTKGLRNLSDKLDATQSAESKRGASEEV